jgi:hypothetical protein
LQLLALELTKRKTAVKFLVVERSLSNKRELVVLVRVQHVHLINVTVELHTVQYLVSTINAHQRR